MTIYSIKNNYFPYVYKITHIPSGKMYIGSRYSKQIIGKYPEEDLGLCYFSSSSNKLFKKHIQVTNKCNYRYEILFYAFGVTYEEAKDNCIEYEILLHNIYDVDNNTLFCNKSKQKENGFHYSKGGRFGKFSEFSKKLMSERKHIILDNGLTIGQQGARRGVITNRILKGEDYFSKKGKESHESRKRNGTVEKSNKNISLALKKKYADGYINANSKFVKVIENNTTIFTGIMKDVCKEFNISKGILNKAIKNKGFIKHTHRTKKHFKNNERVLSYMFILVEN